MDSADNVDIEYIDNVDTVDGVIVFHIHDFPWMPPTNVSVKYSITTTTD